MAKKSTTSPIKGGNIRKAPSNVKTTDKCKKKYKKK